MNGTIELQEVALRRGPNVILNDISVTFPAAKTTVILGPSGSGKSILLKVAAGIMLPDEGRVLVDGKSLTAMSDRENTLFRRATGFVFQDSALWSNSTIYQNISLPLKFHEPSLGPDAVRARVEELIQAVGYRDSIARRPDDASAGERKIVSFMRALVMRPALLFFDEPLIGVDLPTAERMIEMIRDLKRDSRTILIVTHDPILTSQLADYLIVLDAGRVLEAGPFTTVVRSTNPEVVALLSRVLSEASTFDGNILDLLDEGMKL